MGDEVSFGINGTNVRNKIFDNIDKTVVFALLSTELEDVYVDFDGEQVLFNDTMIPFESLGLRT